MAFGGFTEDTLRFFDVGDFEDAKDLAVTAARTAIGVFDADVFLGQAFADMGESAWLILEFDGDDIGFGEMGV